MSVNTKVVYRCQNDQLAEQLRLFLKHEGIICQVASDIPHSIFPLTTDGLGEIRISVLSSVAERAKELIDAFLSGETVPEVELLEETEISERGVNSEQ